MAALLGPGGDRPARPRLTTDPTRSRISDSATPVPDWPALLQQGTGTGGRTYHVLLGEQALRTGIDGPAVMGPQLERLLDALSLPGLTLGVIPARARLTVHPGDGFGIFDGTRVEVEGYRGGETITDRRVDLFRRAFDRLRESAVYGEDARAVIASALRAVRRAARARSDGPRGR
ncbi:Scr1 family TA system antitoxin-like transcriptional regulator [Kitasatospora sp. NPDC056184]|uniref:Scr1 family TA system antitoxin-like transcriptional regulator n=1 Tax=Kitasatospora sp. NPDC056184 TaxID=3345738 RepID=UPI0035D78E35